MPNLMLAYDCSIDGKVELYLFWYPHGEVDVAIYIHDIPARRRAKFIDLDINPPDNIPDNADFRYKFEEAPGIINSVHTEYFEYTLPVVPQDVMADYRPSPTGTVSSANAEAL